MILYLLNLLFDCTVASAIVLFTTIYYYSTSTYNKWRKLNVPCIRPLPVFGNTFKMALALEHQVDTFNGVYARFADKKYCGFFFMTTPFLMIRDPELINRIMIKDFSNFTDRGFHKDPSTNMTANALFFSKNPKWRIMRQKLSPGFSSGKLKLTHGQIKSCSDDLMRYFGEKIKTNDQIEVQEIMGKYAIDVIATCAFGLKLDTVKNDDSDFRKFGRVLVTVNLRQILTQLLGFISPKILRFFGIQEFAPDAVEYYRSALSEVFKYREANNIVRNDVAQTLIQARKELVLNKNPEYECDFTEDDIVGNAILLFVVGFETVASTLSFCLYQLALNQDVQNKLREEMISIKKKHGEFNNDFLMDLHYADMVLAETVRMYVTTTAIFREAKNNYQVPNDSLVIEKGQRILIPLYSLHQDPKYFPNPHIFDPRRFSPEEKAKRLSGTYLPFGDGPRFCIAKQFAELEMKLVLSEIITNFQVSPCEQTEIPLQLQNGSTAMAPKNGIRLRFKQISK